MWWPLSLATSGGSTIHLTTVSAPPSPRTPTWLTSLCQALRVISVLLFPALLSSRLAHPRSFQTV